MHNVINSLAVKNALRQLGWSQAELATRLSESPQVVSHWLKGDNFPRPDKLLRLGVALKLNFEQLVSSPAVQPVVAFRAKANTKTTQAHIQKAQAMGNWLRHLVPFLSPRRHLRTELTLSSPSYQSFQDAAQQVRQKLKLDALSPLDYASLIAEFKDNDAVLVPVLWGEQEKHKNALHLLLPDLAVTFVYLNLDTYAADFKFWMAHELAHVYTPKLAGTEAGEDFADAFASALLYPAARAAVFYVTDLQRCLSKTQQVIEVLVSEAQRYDVSLYTVYKQVQDYAQAQSLPLLEIHEAALHAARVQQRGAMICQTLFGEQPPTALQLITVAKTTFRSEFFEAMGKLIQSHGTAAGFVQQVLDIGLIDAKNVHTQLLVEASF
jgi:transcriptional regulator with XRE-family HTH domain